MYSRNGIYARLRVPVSALVHEDPEGGSYRRGISSSLIQASGAVLCRLVVDRRWHDDADGCVRTFFRIDRGAWCAVWSGGKRGMWPTWPSLVFLTRNTATSSAGAWTDINSHQSAKARLQRRHLEVWYCTVRLPVGTCPSRRLIKVTHVGACSIQGAVSASSFSRPPVEACAGWRLPAL